MERCPGGRDSGLPCTTLRSDTISDRFDADANRNRISYPSGQSDNYTFDDAGRPLTAASASRTFVSSATYLSFGPMRTIVYGNGTQQSTILNFRHLLEEHELTKAMFERINGLMEGKGLLLRSGTIVDATIIAAPSSTKNGTESRDPEMKQTKKGKNWHFGMKVHVGTDKRGVVHSMMATHAATADITQMDTLLHGQERTIFGDQAYWKEGDRQRFRAAGVRYRVNRRGTKQRPLTDHQKKINQSRSRHRARGEHAFRIVKQLWGFAKVRYRGIAKNAARAFTSFALANLYLMRRCIVPHQEWCL